MGFLKDELNTYLLSRTGSDTVKANLSKVVDEAGKYAFAIDSICCSIINIEEERLLKSHLPDYTNVNGQHVILEPELRLNLHVLFACNFTHYDQALKYISYVLTYFQAHPVFTSNEYPALTPEIGKLTAELLSLNYEQLNQIWAFIGGKQLPSVVYKVRMVTLQDAAQTAVRPQLSTIRTTIQSL
ncbi:MAG: DUF4255 domain-containing protein [Pedobacter sp.]